MARAGEPDYEAFKRDYLEKHRIDSRTRARIEAMNAKIFFCRCERDREPGGLLERKEDKRYAR